MHMLKTDTRDDGAAAVLPSPDLAETAPPPIPARASLHVALLTGGDDRPYALGMASALAGEGIQVDFIGSDALDAPELHATPGLRFLNLRGDQRESAGYAAKMWRILAYYSRLMHYAATAQTRVFHILWNNKFELFDRTVLMLFYRLLGKRVLLTAHNVNAARRDARDGWLNRLSLRIQYRLCSHIFVHTEKMRAELTTGFGVAPARVTVIPFGINDTIPKTRLTPAGAREVLGLPSNSRTLLFFGQIAPYKGLDYLVEALDLLDDLDPPLHLIVAGKIKRGAEDYWERVRTGLGPSVARGRAVCHIGFIPDEEVERYFKAADVVVLPYREIFQSGVPFLAFAFGVPVIATDVGSLREDVVAGANGSLCRPHDPAALASAIRAYFAGDIFRHLDERRSAIRGAALRRHSWATVGGILRRVYESTTSD
jgi:D-inositol-3-phosphate glycosyltransferase